MNKFTYQGIKQMNDHTNLEKLNSLLQSNDADYSILSDELSLATAASGAAQYGISLNETTPTLILKTKDAYIAAIICGNTRISFKKLKTALNVKDISMADPETIFNITGAKIGEVSLINPALTTLIDSHVLKNEYCYGGCGIPKKTLRIKTDDLIKITNAQVLDFAEMRE